PIVDNPNADGDRTIVLQLSNASLPAVLGNPSQAVVTIVDDEQTLRFAALGFSVLENKGPAVVTVERHGNPVGTLTATFATVNGTATAPADYTAVTKTLTFGPGVRTQTVSIPIVNDTLIEGNETFDVRLTSLALTGAAGDVDFAAAGCATFVTHAQCA